MSGLFLQLSPETIKEFRTEIERRKGRAIRRGDMRDAGEEAILAWIASKPDLS
jgi:hypothetical protein